MKIIHIFAGDLKSVSEGGIATYIRELIKKHGAANMDVALIGVTGDKNDKIGEWNDKKIEGYPLKFMPLFHTPEYHITYKSGMPLNAKFLLSLWINKRKFLVPGQVLHIHRTELALPFLISKTTVPIVLTIHGLARAIEFKVNHILYKMRWFRHLFYKIESFAIRKMNKVILVSQEGMDYYKEKFPEEIGKLILIPTSVDTELFKPMDKIMLRSKRNFRSDEKILLFAGRFDYLKGLDLLIDAFKLVKKDIADIQLLLVGGGAEQEHIKTKIKEIGLRGIQFIEMVSHEILPELMNCADIFVLTSIWEGMPLVVLEAMACGLPVVATNVGQLSEIVKEGLTGYLVNTRDAGDVRNKIVLALKGAGEMSENCRKMAEEYSSSRVAEMINKVYCEILQKK